MDSHTCARYGFASWRVVVLVGTVLFLGGCPSVSLAAKILLPAISLVSSPSHYVGLSSLTKELTQRGHDVTLLLLDRRGTAGILDNSTTDNITFPNSMTEEEMAETRNVMQSAMSAFSHIPLLEKIFVKMPYMYNLVFFGCRELFKSDATLVLLRQRKYDLILSSPVVDTCDSLLAAYLDVPFVVLTGSRRTPVFSEDTLGIPIQSALVPFSLFRQVSHAMTFSERVTNFVVRYVVHAGLIEYVFIDRPIGQLQAQYGIRPDLSPREIVARADLWLCHTTFALDLPRVTAPNWIPVAGFMIKAAQPIPEHLADFIDGAGEHGFILFTLGSMTTSLSDMEATNAMSKVFSELKQRVVWRYKGPTPKHLANNTLIVQTWLPQSDILAHPKARLLIYHGGAAGVHEAVFHGVPMVLLPLGADQPANAAMVEDRGLGISLDRLNLDEDLFRRAVHRVLQEPRFKANAARASDIFHDDVTSPMERAVFWVEHVLKYGGDHLRLRATDMNLIQLNSVDVCAFLITIILLTCYTFWKVLRFCCYRLRERGKKKTD